MTETERNLLFFLQTLHCGRKSAISSRIIEKQFCMKGTEVRKTINNLRSEGYPICSDTIGYYYAANQAEINNTISQLNSRITKISNARNGLLCSTVICDLTPKCTLLNHDKGE